MKSFFTRIISFLFPETCVVCKKEGVSLCTSCTQNLPLAPFLDETWMHTLFSYQDKKVRTIVHALKFNHTQSIATHIAPLLRDVLQDIQGQSLDLKNEVLILLPVPRMQTHLKQRGFDAVLHLCKEITHVNTHQYQIVHNAIVRTNTRAQVGLSRSERLTNMKNAFKIISPESLGNHRICIVDDVITTGSTLRELRKICLEARAKEVFAITIAH